MNRIYAILLVLTAAAGAAFVVMPMMLLKPFEPQTAADVARAYSLRQWSPAVTLALLALGALLLALAWKKSAWWLRIPAALAVVLLGGTAYAARINMFEGMFAPMSEVGFLDAAEAEHVAAEEMVMGIEIGGEAKAYPVGVMAYHHVVNDQLGGSALVVTY